MKLLGSVIYLTSAFYSFEGEDSLVHWTHSFLYFYHNAGWLSFQDGMFHKKKRQISDKMRIDNAERSVVY